MAVKKRRERPPSRKSRKPYMRAGEADAIAQEEIRRLSVRLHDAELSRDLAQQRLSRLVNSEQIFLRFLRLVETLETTLSQYKRVVGRYQFEELMAGRVPSAKPPRPRGRR